MEVPYTITITDTQEILGGNKFDFIEIIVGLSPGELEFHPVVTDETGYYRTGLGVFLKFSQYNSKAIAIIYQDTVDFLDGNIISHTDPRIYEVYIKKYISLCHMI